MEDRRDGCRTSSPVERRRKPQANERVGSARTARRVPVSRGSIPARETAGWNSVDIARTKSAQRLLIVKKALLQAADRRERLRLAYARQMRRLSVAGAYSRKS